MGLRLTSATDYGVRAMIHLASIPVGRRALREEIAEAERIPSSFVAKVLRSLVRADLLKAVRGVNGGFSLARDPEQINLLEIVEAVEGPIRLFNCTNPEKGCEQEPQCPAAPVWKTMQEDMRRTMRNKSLEDLVSVRRCNGRVVAAAPTMSLGLAESEPRA